MALRLTIGPCQGNSRLPTAGRVFMRLLANPSVSLHTPAREAAPVTGLNPPKGRSSLAGFE